MKNIKFYATMFGACAFSGVMGVTLGYFIFGAIAVSAITGNSAVPDENFPGYAEVGTFAPYESQEAPSEPEEPHGTEPPHRYIVTSEDGVIVVFRSTGERHLIVERTDIAVNALPPEEQERLYHGIFIYTEEALVRILEDYGS